MHLEQASNSSQSQRRSRPRNVGCANNVRAGVLSEGICVQLVERAGWLARTANAWLANVFASALFVREVFAHLRDGDVALNLLAETLMVYRRCERWVEHVVTHTRTSS